MTFEIEICMTRGSLLILLSVICIDAYGRKDSVFIPYGLARYSFNWDIAKVRNSDDTGCFPIKYSNKIGIFYGFLINLNSKISVQFQFGNDWTRINRVTFPFNNSIPVSDRSCLPFALPCFHLAFIKLNLGLWYMEAGKVPLKNSGPLNLIGRSLATGDYHGAAFIGWSDAVNNSLLGVKSGLYVLKNQTLCAEFFSTIIDKRNNNRSEFPAPAKHLFVFSLPFCSDKFSLSPQLAFIINKNFNHLNGKSDHELGLGFSSTYKLSEYAGFHLMGAWARLTNYNSKLSVDSPGGPPEFFFEYDKRGFEIGWGSSFKKGAALIGFDTRYSRRQNKKSRDSVYHFIQGDLECKISPLSRISITPRLRFLHAIYPNHAGPGNFLFCPELILAGHF